MKIFDYVGISSELRNAFNYLVVFLLFAMTYKIIFNKTYNNIRFFLLMKLIFFSTFFSIFFSSLFWNQDLLRSFAVTSTLFGILYYFFLIETRPRLDDIKRLIYGYTVLFIFLWIFALYKAPEVVFNVTNIDGELEQDRGIFRLNIIGRQFLVLCFFLCLNDWIVLKRKISLFFMAICFLFIVFQVTRQVILFSFIIGFLYFIYNHKNKLLLFFVFFSLLFTFQNLSLGEDTLIGSLVNLSESQIENNRSTDDIRISAAYYYVTEFPNNFLTTLFGNGVHFNKSEYGLYLTKINNNLRYYLSDIGYVSMYITVGLFGLILYLILFLKISFAKVNSHVYFGKLFIIYMLFSNLGADWYAKPDGVLLICISVYVLSMKINVIKNNQIPFSIDKSANI